MDHFRKKVQRVQVQTSQILGRTEKTDVLSEVHDVEQRLERMVNAVEQTRDKLYDYVNKSKSTNESVEKRKAKLKDACALETALQQQSFELLKDKEDAPLLGTILQLYAATVSHITHDTAKLELDCESNVLDRFKAYTEEYKEIGVQREKLKRQVLDYDSARRRLAQVSGDNEREAQLQDEVDNIHMRLENTRDALVANMYQLASKETEIASLFAVLIDLQRSHHQAISEQLNVLLPLVHRKIATCPNRPVFGCPLEDHLRYTNRQIALVIEVCCAALCELGLDEEGLFRLSGNQTRIRKLKACFDCGQVGSVVADYVHDAHSLAGVLKCYLRELPDPLMSAALYNLWAQAAGAQTLVGRKEAIKSVLSMLPPNNYANLRYVIKFLALVATHEPSTRMSSYNLAVVIGPNVIWSPLGGDNSLGCKLVELLIDHHEYFFPGEVDFSSKLIQSLVDRTGGFLANAHGLSGSMTISAANSQSSSPQGTLSKAAGAEQLNHMINSHMSSLPRSKSPSLSLDSDQPNAVVLRNDGPQPHRAPARRPKTAAPPPPTNAKQTTPTKAVTPPPVISEVASLYPVVSDVESELNVSVESKDGVADNSKPTAGQQQQTAADSNSKPATGTPAAAAAAPPQRPPPPKTQQQQQPDQQQQQQQQGRPPSHSTIGVEPQAAPRKSLLVSDPPAAAAKTHRKTNSETGGLPSAESPTQRDKPPVPIKPKPTEAQPSVTKL